MKNGLVQFLELFADDPRSFQVKPFLSKKLITLLDKAQLIWANSETRIGHKKQKFGHY